MAAIRIATLNCNGLGHRNKRKKSFTHFADTRTDVVLLQETHTTNATAGITELQQLKQDIFIEDTWRARNPRLGVFTWATPNKTHSQPPRQDLPVHLTTHLTHQKDHHNRTHGRTTELESTPPAPIGYHPGGGVEAEHSTPEAA